MAGQEHESGIMQWALSLLDGDPAYNTVYNGDMIQHDANDIYHGQYFRGQYGTESNHVENDEIIAHTLQEEYSRLSVAEASRYSHGDEEQSQASTHADDWYSLSRRNYCSGIQKTIACTFSFVNLYHFSCIDRHFLHHADSDYPNEGACTVVPSSSCSSPGRLELTDECAVDGEVGWSFNEMMPVPVSICSVSLTFL